MNYVMLIEQHGKQNAIKIDFKDNQPVIVGRSWQCDVVVIDQYVDAEHLRISANDDQGISIEDLQSHNGTRLKKMAIDTAINYKTGDEIHVGETTLRLIDADHEVRAAVKYDEVIRIARKFGNIPSIIVSTVIAACLSMAVVFWGGDEYVSRSSIIEGAFGFSLILSGWCLICSIGSWLVRAKSYYSLHWTFTCGLFSAVAALFLISNVVKFNLGSILADNIIDHTLRAVSFAALMYWLFTFVSRYQRAQKLLFVSCTVAVFLLLNITKPMLTPEQEKWSSYVNVGHTGQPPAFFIGRTDELELHFEKTENLFEKVLENVE